MIMCQLIELGMECVHHHYHHHYGRFSIFFQIQFNAIRWINAIPEMGLQLNVKWDLVCWFLFRRLMKTSREGEKKKPEFKWWSNENANIYTQRLKFNTQWPHHTHMHARTHSKFQMGILNFRNPFLSMKFSACIALKYKQYASTQRQKYSTRRYVCRMYRKSYDCGLCSVPPPHTHSNALAFAIHIYACTFIRWISLWASCSRTLPVFPFSRTLEIHPHLNEIPYIFAEH